MKYLLFIIFFLQSCITGNQIKITQVFPTGFPFRAVDTLTTDEGIRLHYNYFFIVNNYRNQKHVEMQIDSFALGFNTNQTYPPNTEEVNFVFYKKSVKNQGKINENSNENDLIYFYVFEPEGKVTRINNDGKEIEIVDGKIKKPKFELILEKVSMN